MVMSSLTLIRCNVAFGPRPGPACARSLRHGSNSCNSSNGFNDSIKSGADTENGSIIAGFELENGSKWNPLVPTLLHLRSASIFSHSDLWLSKDSRVTEGVTLSVHPSPFWYSLEQMFQDCDNGSLPGHWRQVPRPRLSVSSSVTNNDPCQSQIVITVRGGGSVTSSGGPGDSLLVTATFYHDIKTDWAPIKSINAICILALNIINDKVAHYF